MDILKINVPHNILKALWISYEETHSVFFPDIIRLAGHINPAEDEYKQLHQIIFHGTYAYGSDDGELKNLAINYPYVSYIEDKCDNMPSVILKALKKHFSQEFLDEYGCYEIHEGSR